MATVKVNYQKALDGLDKWANIDLTNAMELIGIDVENNARIHCPVDTGILRNSITHQLQSNNEVEIGTNLFYAPFVELGTGIYALNGDGRQDVPWRYKDAEGKWHTTSGQHPKQFMKQGLDDSIKDFSKIIAHEIGRQTGHNAGL